MLSGKSPEQPSETEIIVSMTSEQQEFLKRAYAGHLATLLALRREEYLATHDELTGLLNFRGLMKSLNHLVDEEPGTFSVVFVDLDDLKKTNDQEGHERGNELLKAAATTLQNTLRTKPENTDKNHRSHSEFRPDIVTLARVGGDEFVVLLRDVGTDNLEFVLMRMNSALEVQGISASLDGVQHMEGETPEEVLDAGDQRMMAVKEMRKDIRRRNKPFWQRLKLEIGRSLLRSVNENPDRIKA